MLEISRPTDAVTLAAGITTNTTTQTVRGRTGYKTFWAEVVGTGAVTATGVMANGPRFEATAAALEKRRFTAEDVGRMTGKRSHRGDRQVPASHSSLGITSDGNGPVGADCKLSRGVAPREEFDAWLVGGKRKRGEL